MASARRCCTAPTHPSGSSRVSQRSATAAASSCSVPCGSAAATSCTRVPSDCSVESPAVPPAASSAQRSAQVQADSRRDGDSGIVASAGHSGSSVDSPPTPYHWAGSAPATPSAASRASSWAAGWVADIEPNAACSSAGAAPPPPVTRARSPSSHARACPTTARRSSAAETVTSRWSAPSPTGGSTRSTNGDGRWSLSRTAVTTSRSRARETATANDRSSSSSTAARACTNRSGPLSPRATRPASTSTRCWAPSRWSRRRRSGQTPSWTPATTTRAHSLPAAPAAVELLTAAGAAGSEWALVGVAGVQEGVWPDLRLRDHLLGAQHLVDVLVGRVARGDSGPERFVQARAAVLDDELRSFAVAVSRARERLVVTAVLDNDQRPSPFVDLVDPPVGEGADHRLVTVSAALDLRAVVGQARAWLEADLARVTGGGGAAPADEQAAFGSMSATHPAAQLLARLAAEGVAGADPAQWYGVGGLSTDEPLWPADATIPLSPSRLESAWTCALRWALEAAGGTAGASTEQSLGTLVHEVAAALPHGTEPELAAAVAERWDTLELPEGWVGAVQHRRADAMVRHLAAYLRTAPDVVAVEQPFSVEVGRVLLRGVVDRLERVTDDDGSIRVRVVDLKTGRSQVALGEAARHAQLGAYQVAVEAGAFDEVTDGARSGGAALVSVGTSTATYSRRDQPVLAADADPSWADALLDEVADVVSRSAMTASGNDLCRVCPVTRSCPLQPVGRVVGS